MLWPYLSQVVVGLYPDQTRLWSYFSLNPHLGACSIITFTIGCCEAIETFVMFIWKASSNMFFAVWFMLIFTTLCFFFTGYMYFRYKKKKQKVIAPNEHHITMLELKQILSEIKSNRGKYVFYHLFSFIRWNSHVCVWSYPPLQVGWAILRSMFINTDLL